MAFIFRGVVAAFRRICLLMPFASLLTAGLSVPVYAKTRVFSTPHNLSVSGPGNIKFTEETRVCEFCHVAHNAGGEGPLWSREVSGNATPYKSSSLNASPKP